MTFTTPCFVRVEDAAKREKLIEWLRSVGYKDFGNPFQSFSYIIYTTVDGYYVNAQASIDNSWIDAGTSIELFKALAAMNDENDREQWFVGDNGEYVKCTDDNFFMFAINVLQKQKRKTGFVSYHKATAEEIVEYFTKRGE